MTRAAAMWHWLLMLAAMVGLVVLCPADVLAQAQSQPQARLGADTNEAEVGETITIELSAMGEQGSETPCCPKLSVPSGFSLVSGPSASSQTSVVVTNGRMTQRQGFKANWQLRATREGMYHLGPGSVQAGGKRWNTNTVDVHVVAAQPGGPRQRRRGNSPFDPFGMFGFPKIPGMDDFDLDTRPSRPAEPPTDSSLSLDVAPDPTVFLRSKLDKQTAVLGEQITLSIYVYVRAGALEQMMDLHEPSAPDFYQKSLMQPGAEAEARTATVAGAPWRVQLLRKIALFPLKTGALEIGPVQLTFVGSAFRALGGHGQGSRESQTLTIRVTDTPAASRPPNFSSGDVGSFSLSATVDPRTIDQHGAMSVSVDLTGNGNFPPKLDVPQRNGVEWLPPEVRDAIDVQHDRIAGTRSFSYVVRVHEAGAIDLGEVRLAYYDPGKRSYQVAKAALGSVQVRPNGAPAAAAASSQASYDPFSSLPGVRTILGPAVRTSVPISEPAWFWIALCGGPLGVVGASASKRALLRLRSLLRSNRQSPARLVREALDGARLAAANAQSSQVASNCERALYTAIDASAGCRSRGVLRAELPVELERFGVSQQVSQSLCKALERCEAARFDSQGAPGLQELVDQVARAITLLPAKSRARTRA